MFFSKKLFKSNLFAKTLIGATGLTMANYFTSQQRKNKCCGIVGILSSQPIAMEYCMEGIELLQNRGYDSVGIATFDKDHQFKLTKYASDTKNKIDCVQKLKKEVQVTHKGHYFGIGHTRWATHGSKTDQNAHPHVSMDGNIFVVHNGTIDDVNSHREYLKSKGITLASETDTELIAQYIMLAVNEKNLNLYNAVLQVTSEVLRGTWGLLVIDKRNPSQMVVARNGSPITIGLHEDTIYIASERLAFEKYTNHYVTLNDGEIMLLDIENRQNFYGQQRQRAHSIKVKQEILLQPRQGYSSFYEQEIHEQPETLLKCMGNGARLSNQEPDCPKLGGLEQHIEEIQQIDNLVIVACGTSFYAGQFAANFFKRLNCFNTIALIEASEFTEMDLPKQNGGAIFITQSGETRDILIALECCKRNGLFTIGVVNVVGSAIATSVKCGVYLNIGREVAVPATKSFTAQSVVLLMIGLFISHHKDQFKSKQLRIQLKDLLRQIPMLFGENIFRITDSCQQVAKILADVHTLMILGKGASGAIAKEGALKIKETTYIHAEAFMAGEMKHGPIAMINPDVVGFTKVILLIFDDEYFHDMHTTLHEVKARNACTIVITNCYHKLDQNKIDHAIQITDSKELSPLVSILAFQKISNEICKINQLDPDKPRNLAKTVTVI